jgi:hypothetical protein
MFSIFLFFVCVCFMLGNPVLEQRYEDFQEQAFEELELFFSGQQGKCP